MAKVAALPDDILGAKDLRQKRVFVKEWDCEVIVQEFSGGELHQVLKLASFSRDGGAADFSMDDAALVCAIAIRNEAGARIFTDEQAPELAAKSMGAIMTVFMAAMEVSGLSKEAQEAEKNG